MPERHHHHHHHHHHWRDRSNYAHRAGAPGPGPNIHRLVRDREHKMIAGVCAGVAKYYGWSQSGLTWFRLAWAGSFFFFGPLSIIAYIVAAIFMKPGGSVEPRMADAEEEKFWRTFSTRPRATFSELKHRFRALDARIADLETAVTSNEFGLRKAFRDLERGV